MVKYYSSCMCVHACVMMEYGRQFRCIGWIEININTQANRYKQRYIVTQTNTIHLLIDIGVVSRLLDLILNIHNYNYNFQNDNIGGEIFKGWDIEVEWALSTLCCDMLSYHGLKDMGSNEHGLELPKLLAKINHFPLLINYLRYLL